MRIVALFSDEYGQRFAQHVREAGPASWETVGYQFTGRLPAVIDEPEEWVPGDLPRGDLLLYVGRDRKLAEILPEMAAASGVKEVLAPVDNRAFLPTGLANQVRRQLGKAGLAALFPAPFCSLREEDSPGGLIGEFARHFGRPALEVRLSGGRIEEVRLKRGAACGNTAYVAARLPGLKAEESVEQAGLFFHAHPCMASMDMDREIGDTILHIAGYLVKGAVEEAVKKAG